ncbi:PSD1 and planctomycete cytochrome C domain-containing protein [Roseibacillus ishigakijimensis]|uniref:PSD1 domain-containing protein n=1 Tax=Roseibacillus ishigakijimensis TaxID=454146 RepID=A0A934RLJ5_9BACT|nr:PSD1 and planctomycete cytochrome C domain-containing protein [Roseibacillus ishigakijimensis]MBK1833624.1 PSD1 domain-containing protein [Roseibacillus ishigakijimensis]
MKKHPLSALLALLALSSSVHGEFTEQERHFTINVLPVLSEKCFGCHGDPNQKIKGGLDMSSLEKLLHGGDNFTDVLVPGDPAASFLMKTVRWEDPDYEMPPKENDRLDDRQIADLEQWIADGAPWPEESVQEEIFLAERERKVTAAGVLIENSGGLADTWTYRRYNPQDIWAFLPLDRSITPSPESPHPIDSFIQEKLTEAGVEKAPPADLRTLIRRASYDLTGLPPTPEEIADFLAASEKNPTKAWDDLIDRLLASPHYGERWAQHWLDVARYADTGGMSNDFERSNAWRYRDYVIRAFNEDKPYNEFIVEQIAGDELADNSLRKRVANEKEFEKARREGLYNEQESEWLVASSFLRSGPWDPAMVMAPEARQLYVDDVVNSVGQTFLATTMRCFKCHDHKFDPLPTRDYYRFYAVFAATQLAERRAPFLSSENRAGFEEGKQLVTRLLNYATEKRDEILAKQEEAARQWYQENKLPYVSLEERKDMADEVKPPRHVGLDYDEQGKLKVREQDVWIWERRQERYQPMVQSVYNGPDPGFLNARKLRLKPNNKPKDWKPEHFIFSGGAYQAPGEKVTPGVLSPLGLPTPTGNAEDPYKIPESIDGRRLALAQWIAHEDNPLTVRSIVNRIWQQHFGKPIAGNPNNFGVKGAKPTHPELLDWLAADFVENGWQFKRLHRLIMSSETYRQAFSHPHYEELETIDPNNDLFAYYPVRRLTAEELRDGMLKITGELNPTQGGLPVMPEINMEVALQPRMIQFSLAPAYLPSPTPEQRNRRSIYSYRVRGMADPFLETFNQPNPNDSCEMRDSASVSPQAFTLMNSDLMTDRSIAFALRLEREASNPVGQIERGFELALGRSPRKEELEMMKSYLQEMRAYHQTSLPAEKVYPTAITRTLIEEFSGQPFQYEEILPVFEDYTPDTKAHEVSAETRALADFCLVLFNSNEFVHVY